MNMMAELTERQKLLLTLIVHEHTRTAQPVGSTTLVKQYGLLMSSATIRNEMTTLTELGYLRQPHTSAGRVPTEEGYRFFVSNLVQQTNLPATTRNTIAHQFYQSRQGVDQWLKLAASVLANQTSAASIVTAPHSEKVRFKHLELLSLHTTQALMVLVLMGGEVRQQLIMLKEATAQEQLSSLALKLNDLYQNFSVDQIVLAEAEQDSLTGQVILALKQQMAAAENVEMGEVYLDGLRNLMAEPEFAETEMNPSPLRLLEERSRLYDLISRTVMTEEVGGLQVLIGGEGTWKELHETAVILTRYGIPDQWTGTLGVLGPMRMAYGHTISTIRFVADLLSDLVSEARLD